MKITELEVRDTMLTAQEVSKLLNIKLGTVYEYAKKGVIPAIKFGDVVRFHPRQLATWIAGGTPKPVADYDFTEHTPCSPELAAAIDAL